MSEIKQLDVRKGNLNLIQTAARFLSRYSHINWALADQTMVSGINFLTGILLARFLGIEEFGRFTLVWMAVLFVNSIHHAMINSPMMSIGSKQPQSEIPTYYGAVVTQEVIFSSLTFLLLLGGTWLSSIAFPAWEVKNLALPLAFAGLFDLSQCFLRRYYFTRGRAAIAFTIDAIRYLGHTAILIWMFISFKETLDTAKVLWVMSATSGIAVVCGAFFFEQIKFEITKLKDITSRHWNFSKWLTGTALMIWTNGSFFIIMTGALIGAWAVGALKAAKSIMGICNILVMGLENIVPAGAARKFHTGGKQALCNYMKRVALFGGLATATLAVIASLAPEFWLGLVYGSEYQEYGFLLQGFAVVYILNFLCFPFMAGLQGMEKSKVIFQTYAWMTLFSLLSFYPLIKYGGLPGVLAGFIIVTLIEVLTLWHGFRRELNKISPLENISDTEISQVAYREKHTGITPSTVLSNFFEYLDEIGLDFCVIGRTEGMPETIVGDIDIVIRPESLKNFPQQVIEFCHLNNLQLVQKFQHEQTAYYFVLSWKDKNGKFQFLHLDMSSNFFQSGRMFLTAEEVLAARTPAIDKAGNKKGFYVFTPATEFIYYLFKKVDKYTLTDDHGKHLRSVWEKDPDGCSKQLERFWSEEGAHMLRRAVKDDNWEEVRQNFPTLEKDLLSKLPSNSFATWGNEFIRVLKRIFYPTGLHVVFLGPDGSGKSCVIERVNQDLTPAFRKTFLFHLRPRFGNKRDTNPPVTNPHGQKPRNFLASIIKVFYFWFDYLMGWLGDVRPRTVRSTLVLFDRYYHDMLIDPKRYRYGGPMWLARWIGKLIPKPDLWILLDAPPEILQERKREVPFTETARQKEEYLKFVNDLNNGFVVNASQKLDNVVADVNTIILDFMAQRMEKRHAQ